MKDGREMEISKQQSEIEMRFKQQSEIEMR